MPYLKTTKLMRQTHRLITLLLRNKIEEKRNKKKEEKLAEVLMWKFSITFI